MLQSISFKCPFCQKIKMTFVDAEMAESIINRQENIQVVLPEKYFPANYREIFISNICCECQKSTFGDDGEPDFDVYVGHNNADVKDRIEKMFNTYLTYLTSKEE